MIIIDNFYKINILQFEAKEDILVFVKNRSDEKVEVKVKVEEIFLFF